MKLKLTLVVGSLFFMLTSGFAQELQTDSTNNFWSHFRFDAGPFYQFDNAVKNMEDIRFKAYGIHGRARYTYDENVHVSFGGQIYKYQYFEKNKSVEITGYLTLMVNPLNSLFSNKTDLFQKLQLMIGLGYEGDSFLQRKRARDGATFNLSAAYFPSNNLSFELAYKNRLWQHESIPTRLGDLTELTTFSIFFDFMSLRKKKVKNPFENSGH